MKCFRKLSKIFREIYIWDGTKERENGSTNIIFFYFKEDHSWRVVHRLTEHLINSLSSSKCLRAFDGDSLEWLKFKRAFELSSNLAEYSDSEKVARLHECLKGEAKEAVSSLLITATGSKQIMDTLELRFGRSDKIVEKLVQEVRALSKVGVGKMDIVTFPPKLKMQWQPCRQSNMYATCTVQSLCEKSEINSNRQLSSSSIVLLA